MTINDVTEFAHHADAMNEADKLNKANDNDLVRYYVARSMARNMTGWKVRRMELRDPTGLPPRFPHLVHRVTS